MTFHNEPLDYKSCNQYPYVGKVKLREKNCTDFIYQFVKRRINTQFFYDMFYNAPDIVGPPKFLNYGELFNSSCFFEDLFYKNPIDISISPWLNKTLSRMNHTLLYKNPASVKKYMDIEFHEAVYPIRVSMYELYKPGNIIQIWAEDTESEWFLLWSGSSQIVSPTSRLFSPPLHSHNFKTKKLRLVWKYNTKLDAVMLIGTSELIRPTNPTESLTNLLKRINYMYFHNENVCNLTADFKNAHIDIIHLQKFLRQIYKSNLRRNIYINNKIHQNLLEKTHCDMQLFKKKRYSHRIVRNYPNKLSSCSLSALSDEIIVEILKHLDLTTLCSISQLNKRFYNLTQDSQFYTSLNIRYIYEPTYISNIFHYFTHRCKYLQRLDLTQSNFCVPNFLKFLTKCGRHLTHLRLSDCISVNNRVLLKISKTCKNLKELDLHQCTRIRDRGFSFLKELENLEHLDLSCTLITGDVLYNILQKNPRMRELNLSNIPQPHSLLPELNNLCRNLEMINLSDTDCTRQDIVALANCKNLRRVNLQLEKFERSTILIHDDILDRLFSSWQHLEEIHLWRIVLTDRNLKLLSECKNLKQLYLCHVISVIFVTYAIIFEKCPKLQEFHFISCDISDHLVNEWRKKYPHVSIYTYV